MTYKPRTRTFGVCTAFVSIFALVIAPVISSLFFSTAHADGQMYTNLEIFNERADRVSEDSVRVTWKTNIPATSYVAFGPSSPERLNYHENLGYESLSDFSSALTKDHDVIMDGMADLPTGTYFFRPYSKKDSSAKIKTIGQELAVFPGSAIHEASSITDHVSTTTDDIDTASITGANNNASTCSAWVTDFIKVGGQNDPSNVRNLQFFLNSFEGFKLAVTGEYDEPTVEAVKVFQKRYETDILAPWNIEEPTGFVYLTTKKAINERFCGSLQSFPLTDAEQKIIADSADASVPDDSGTLSEGDVDDGSAEVPAGEISTPDDGIADGISLDEEGFGDVTTTTSPNEIDGSVSTVTPVTFLNGLLEGIPDFEIPLVLAILAAVLLGLGGFILLRSFRGGPDTTGEWLTSVSDAGGRPTESDSILLGAPQSDESLSKTKVGTDDQQTKTATGISAPSGEDSTKGSTK